MVKKADTLEKVSVTALRGGDGALVKTILGTAEESFGHVTLFSTFTFPPKSSIGYHTHDANCEYYYMLSGDLTLTEDGGAETVLHPGDVSLCRDGHGHSVRNHTDSQAVMLAMIVEK